ncbi:S-adenosyl-L-methionine-dependent methyltransferase [Biscogniauxia mediterranea]|nr:S-adenosyl-L-methionine-dependent methyltransferase [Biscogniauxia mediterranea]
MSVPGPNTGPSTSTLGITTSSIHSETPPEDRRDSVRPGTPSSSQSAAAWDPVSYRIGATTSGDDRSSSAPSEFWPRSDSDTAEDEGPTTSSKRSYTGKSSGTSRFFRAILQRFGRSYNKRYEFLPNDIVCFNLLLESHPVSEANLSNAVKQEKNRNVLQHKIMLEVFDGRLHLAPVVKPRRVLDLGTGPGDWVLGFGKRNPKSAVLGIDLERVHPEYELPNCRFQVFDFTERWMFGSFDFIHLRMLGSLPSDEVLNSIYDNLNPGGWAEFTEWIVILQSPDHSIDHTAFYKWNRYIQKGKTICLIKSLYHAADYKNVLRKAGFVNITERKYAVPVNTWPPGKQLQRIGTMMTTNYMTIIEALSLPIFTEILGWSRQAFDSLLVDVKKDIGDPRIHSFMTLVTVYAQKPREPPSSASSAQSIRAG